MISIPPGPVTLSDEVAWYRGNSHERLHDVDGKRVLRGGGWFDEHWSCRASVRRRGHPTFSVDDVGFRVARSVP